MAKTTRVLKHLFTTAATGKRAFPPATLEGIQKSIAAGERLHRAEIRLIIEPALPFSHALNGISARERARELFAQYRIWDTEENLGILVYINLADHKVEIVTDRGAGRAVPREEWQSICAAMTEGFRRGAFHDSAMAALAQMNGLLAQRLPSDGANPNELPNKPLML